MENRRQSQYSSAPGVGEDSSRGRTPASKPGASLYNQPRSLFLSLCDLTEVYLRISCRGPGAALILSLADQMRRAAGADPDD